MKNRDKKIELRGYQTHGRIFGWGSGPEADWRVMFAVFTVLLFLIALLSATSFWEAKSGEYGDASSVERVPIDKDKLHSTAVHYQRLRLDFDALRATPETTPDPSR